MKRKLLYLASCILTFVVYLLLTLTIIYYNIHCSITMLAVLLMSTMYVRGCEEINRYLTNKYEE